MEKGDLVTVADRFGIENYGLITGTVIMDEMLFIITFFDGSELVVHPSRVKMVPKVTNAEG